MNSVEAESALWMEDEFFDEATRAELKGLDAKELYERFYKRLKFGTGGMRGEMGAGTNRMNKYSVARAAAAVGCWLLEDIGDERCARDGVVIAYDTRNNSEFFAKISADILKSMGIRVRILRAAAPTPGLSFSVTRLGAVAGIVITASHNPKEDNGFKVYDQNGVQAVNAITDRISYFMEQIEDYRELFFKEYEHELIDLEDIYVREVLNNDIRVSDEAKAAVRIVYTPLHGTGNMTVRKTLGAAWFKQVIIVDEQEKPDGNFPTVKTPNPENGEALSKGINLARAYEADIVLGTDPDADRVGVAVRHRGEYRLLTGNQTGALLMDYIVHYADLSKFKKPAVIKTAVTSDLGAEIAMKHGMKVFTTLTGFKYAGEKIAEFEKAKATGDELRNYDFVFGYEESYGCLYGTYTHDKDAIIACLLISDMAALYKTQGKTLIDRLNEIYAEYGYYLDAQDSFKLTGSDGAKRIKAAMDALRKNGFELDGIKETIDYSTGVQAEEGFKPLPKSNVLKGIFEDGSWIAVRPSGTEPKLKVYYSIRGDGRTDAENKFKEIREKLLKSMNM